MPLGYALASFCVATVACTRDQPYITHNLGFVITDTPGRRDAVHMHFTIPKLFVRFSCSGLPSTQDIDVYRLDQWKSVIRSQGFDEAYFFLHVENANVAPELAKWAYQHFLKPWFVYMLKTK